MINGEQQSMNDENEGDDGEFEVDLRLAQKQRSLKYNVQQLKTEYDLDPAMGGGGFGPSHRRNSSENIIQPGSVRDSQRQVTIVLQGIPEVDGVQGQTIHSRWNCFLDVTDLAKREGALTGAEAGGNTPLLGGGGGATPQKQLYAPQPSHPSSLLPSQYTSSGTPTQSYQQHQLHHRNQSLPSSPQPQQALQKGSSLVRRVSSSSSPPVLNNRHSGGPNMSNEVRGRRSSVVSDGTPTSQHQQQFQPQQRGPQSNAGRKSGLGGWAYGRSNNENNQGGLAPVQEAGSAHQSPVAGHAVAESETGSYEDETTSQPHGLMNAHSSRPAMNGGGLGLDLAAQVLNGASQSRPDQDGGDGIVVSFAGRPKCLSNLNFSTAFLVCQLATYRFFICILTTL